MEVKVICDSDVLIDYWDNTKNRHLATKHIINNIIGVDKVLISAISYMELMVGVKNKQDFIRIQKNLKTFNFILLNETITEISFGLLNNYRLSHGLSIPDCMIAATALHSGMEFFTYNIKDFIFIENLNLYNAAFTK